MTIINFVKSVVKQRQLLIDSNQSYKNKYQSLKIITRLQNNLCSVSTKKSEARFFLRFYDDILYITPPQRKKQFNQIHKQAKSINNYEIT